MAAETAAHGVAETVRHHCRSDRDEEPSESEAGDDPNRSVVTAVSRSLRPPEPARVIDVRCSAALPTRDEEPVRCQLFAGHDGPHAVMFARAGQRVVRTWRAGDPDGALDCEA